MMSRHLGRDIAWVLALKLALLSLLYLLFFQGDGRPPSDADAVARHLLAPVSAPAAGKAG